MNDDEFINWTFLYCYRLTPLVYKFMSLKFWSFFFFFLFDLHGQYGKCQSETVTFFFLSLSIANSYLMHDIWASVCSWVALKILANLSLIVLIKLGPYKKNLEINLCNSSEYLITLSFVKIVCNIPVNNAWSECGGSTLKRIKQTKSFKNGALNCSADNLN